MSFYSQSSRPPTKSSYTSTSQHSLSRSNSSRVVSSLNRSKELLSVEEELKELLKNSHFNDKQKLAFWEMLESTFDLFQSPLQNGYQNESLIDSSSLELYSKMQSLVTALSSLIMNEEEELVKNEKSIGNKSNDSTEFSDEENDNNNNNSNFFNEAKSTTFPKSASISNLRISSQNNSRRSSINHPLHNNSESRRSSIYFKNSPNLQHTQLHSPHQFESNPLSSRSNSIRQNDKSYHGLKQDHGNNHLKNSFKALQTPIPRSFSGRSERPKSMYVENQTPPLPSYSSPLRSNYDQFNQEFGSETSFDNTAGQRSNFGRRDSNLSNISSRSVNKSKRYSMRF
ncbi:Interferon alpha-10 [Wickerhamomyces ciferrii]|uniref:Interferon alpha-10 n=1 Tax=Wickerhamomyces ciferrii (strain ATCC 14091 / BCRC 22168 / CBS 111 / JCM 3599 / NBRC 0793 / NRRL Y-1031 F-60-10) TaxID=1206466 RepID=K0KN00_WICCF|nr:Interferon alpha-10 [Wickerhamomyces ciferrii]CCH43587.1 Interferon alpha-10 [Wickerhamomyces ciferrii]